MGPDVMIATLNPATVRFANGVGSIGDIRARRRVFEETKAKGFQFVTIRHPWTLVDPEAILGEGTQVMAGAVVQPGVRTGRNVIVNSGAIVEHDRRLPITFV